MKLETKFNEVSIYLRQEVERSTGLVQKAETTEAKYRKVKIALKEVMTKVKEQEAIVEKNNAEEKNTEELVKLRQEGEQKTKQLSELHEQMAETEMYLYQEKTTTEQHNIILAKKDNELEDIKKILEDKIEQIEHLQIVFFCFVKIKIANFRFQKQVQSC